MKRFFAGCLTVTLTMHAHGARADDIHNLIDGCQAVDQINNGQKPESSSAFFAGVCLTLVQQKRQSQQILENRLDRLEMEKGHISNQAIGDHLADIVSIEDEEGLGFCVPNTETVLDMVHAVVGFYHANGSEPGISPSAFISRALKAKYSCNNH
ncbi:hypothetical protein [Gluconobacter oxydans]|uniref:hypothetical protein n=1 Tax=Gluconobacter oxydans TaxID=442 RepID=UPI0012DAA3F7|nr:hypothetical protein [Gluconobacter oxydans]